MNVNNQPDLSLGIVLFKGHTHCIWWKLRTQLEKFLLIFWIIACIVLFGLFIAVIIVNFSPIFSAQNTVCTTPTCLKSAAQILNLIDETIDPCHDFYKFSCGQWLKSYVIPDDYHMISSFSSTQEKLNLKLKNLIEKPLNGNESRTVTSIKNMYNSCLNLTATRNNSTEQLLNHLKVFGGWPVIEGDNWNQSDFNWIEMIGKMRKLGFKHQFFLNIRIAPNLKRNTIYNIYLTEPTFSTLKNNDLKDGLQNTRVRHYLNFMTSIATLLGADKNRSKTEFKDAIQLESMIAKIPQHSIVYESLTLKELEKCAPNTNWTHFINNVLSVNYTINETEIVLIQNRELVRALDAVFGRYQHKNKRALANYIIWRIVSQSMWTLDYRFSKLEENFLSKIRYQRRNLKRWKLCLNQINANMKTALTHLYIINDESREKSRKLAIEMFIDIKTELMQKFDEIEWIDEETRSSAKFKTRDMNRFIGFSNELLNETKIDQIHESLEELENDNLFMNVLRLRKWTFHSEYSNLRNFNNRSDWQKSLTLAVVNAYYSPLMNSIKIPIWILQPIFFNPDRPQYLNYGALGYIISHEVMHGFDTIGGRFDKRGNLRDWWDVESKQIFDTKSQCLVKQYDNYNLSYQLHINGKSTLSENIADNAGINTAFQAYQEYIRRNGEELPLPGLNYSGEQLFWISAANIWCAKLTPEGYRNFVKNSIHSLSEYRVFVPFSNSRQFSKSWKCKVGDRMNPRHKCKVW